ncbi:hypothetical protein RQP46_009849 [Phenoliferia psychrophenolica]
MNTVLYPLTIADVAGLQNELIRGIWAIRVPVGEIPPEYASFGWESTTSADVAPFPVPSLLPTSAEVVPIPPISYFKVSGFPITAIDIAKANQPLVAVRIATFANCQTVGLSISHGAFDGIGAGMIVKALQAELSGRGDEWSAPSFTEPNVFAERLGEIHQELETLPPTSIDTALRHVAAGSAKSFWDTARLVLDIARENLWHKCTPGEIFLGRDLFSRLIDTVKADVKAATGGAEWVSTGDILLAWTIKAIFGAEPHNHRSLLTMACWDNRSVASTPTKPLASYPHNAMTFYFYGNGPVSSLASTPLSTLALANRRTLDQARNVAGVHTALTWQHATQPIPARRRGTEALCGSSHIAAGLPQISWGAPPEALRGWWVWMWGAADHIAFFNELSDGWIVTVSTRPSRWESVLAELEKLKEA